MQLIQDFVSWNSNWKRGTSAERRANKIFKRVKLQLFMVGWWRIRIVERMLAYENLTNCLFCGL